jgi:hypothetical protein
LLFFILASHDSIAERPTARIDPADSSAIGLEDNGG